MGYLLDAEREGGQRFPGRQDDFDPERLALDGGRPQHFRFTTFEEVLPGDYGKGPIRHRLLCVACGSVRAEEADFRSGDHLRTDTHPHGQRTGGGQ